MRRFDYFETRGFLYADGAFMILGGRTPWVGDRGFATSAAPIDATPVSMGSYVT